MTILQHIAYARSGDKGAHSNIGVIAYNEAGYQYLVQNLTTIVVQEYFSNLNCSEVIRYELPNLLALNFVLKGALGDGGSRSLKLDAQGKALGQRLLLLPIDITEEMLKKMERNR